MEFRLPGVPPAELVDLHEKHALSDQEYKLAIEWATKPPTRERWALFLRDWFLVFGVLLLVAGVIVFGAYNWQALPRLQKLGILQLLIAGAWMGSRLRHPDSVEGHCLLWAASLLVGALLAVFGQIYQTGADAYSLFLGWSLLITPWCLAGRSNLLWLTQATLLNVALVLFWQQRMGAESEFFALTYAAFNGGLAFLWEKARHRETWMSPIMTDALLANGMTPLTLLACSTFWGESGSWLCLVANVAILLGLVHRFPDLVRRMAIVAFSAVTLVGAGTIRLLWELREFGFILIAIVLLALVTVAASWLRRIDARTSPQVAAEQSGPSARPDVLSVLAQNGLLEETPAPEERRGVRSAPKYISVLVALGAWLASWFFLAFVVLFISSSESGLMSIGLLLWAATILLRRHWGAKSDFAAHLCLSVNIAGQLIVLLGAALVGEWDFQVVSGLALVLQLVGLVWFSDSLGRGLFSFASVVSGGLFFGDALGGTGVSVWLLAIAYLVSRLLLGQRGWLLSRWRYWYGSVAFGWCCGLLTVVGVWGGQFQLLNENDLTAPMLLTGGLTLLAVANALRLQAPFTGVVALLVLGGLTATIPGMMAAVLVFMLAFHTRSLGASWLSILGLMVFGILYYYNLNITFLAKSLTLMASGVVLLLARLSLRAGKVRHAF